MILAETILQNLHVEHGAGATFARNGHSQVDIAPVMAIGDRRVCL